MEGEGKRFSKSDREIGRNLSSGVDDGKSEEVDEGAAAQQWKIIQRGGGFWG